MTRINHMLTQINLEHELATLPEHLSSPTYFSRVRVARSLASV